jgi:hypothetical protein
MDRKVSLSLKLVRGLLLGLGLLAVNAWVLVEHYLGDVVAFELLRQDQRPMGNDRLLGPLLGTLAPEATFVDAQALVLALVIWYLAHHLARDTFELLDLRRQAVAWRERGDEREAQALSAVMRQRLAELVPFLVLLAVTASWEAWLYQYRTLSGVVGLEEPEQAVGLVPAQLGAQVQGSAAYFLAVCGAWFYATTTIGAAFLLVAQGRRTGETWTALCRSWEEDEEPQAEEVEVAAEEVTVPGQLADTVAPPPAATDLSPQLAAPALFPSPVPAPRPTGMSAEAPRPTVSAPAAAPEADLHPVLGSAERVAVSAALALPQRYHVDLATGRIWEMAYWESLHREPEPAELG